MTVRHQQRILATLLAAILFAGVFPRQALAEAITQTLLLIPGWNAVYFEVQPPDNNCDAVFNDLIIDNDLESVWAWDSDTTAGTFLTDPYTVPSDDTIKMLGYYPDLPEVSNLHAVHGGNAYLIHIEAAAPNPAVLKITGEPVLPAGNWQQDGFNFVGFPIDAGNEPFYSSFFASDPALDGQDIYRLRENGGVFEWQLAQASDTMQSGEGFWIKCDGFSDFTGPLEVDPPMNAGLDYADINTELPLDLGNATASARTVTITSVSAATLPELYYYDYDSFDWASLPAGGANFAIDGESNLDIRIGVGRADMTAGEVRTANLELRADGAEHAFARVPVSVVGIERKGLWVGYATIDQVNRPGMTSAANPDPALESAPSEFTFPLIIHNGGTAINLLREAVMVNNKYTFEPEIHLEAPAEWAGIALRDGRPVGRRVSSAAFGFRGAYLLGSGFDTADTPPAKTGTGIFAEGETLTATLIMEKYDPEDDTGSPVHPYQHRMHPRDGMLPGDAFKITRNLALTFDDALTGEPPAGVSRLAYGANTMGGTYEETIYGLQKHPVKVKGRFVLSKVSSVETLQ